MSRIPMAGFMMAVASLLLIGCKDSAPNRGDPRILASLDAEISTFYAQSKTAAAPAGVVALVDDAYHGVKWEAARGTIGDASNTPASIDTPFRIASITKTFVAAATFKLIEQQRLALNGPIDALLSDQSIEALKAGGADPARITVRQLLGHRSGLFDYAATLEYFTAVKQNPRRRWTRIEQVQLALQLRPPVEPDSVYAYSDTNYILLGEILERATGRDLAAALRTTLDFEGLGLEKTWLESLEPAPPGMLERLHQRIAGIDTFEADPSYDLWGGGGLVSTVQDLGRFYRALFQGNLLAEATVEQMSNAVSGGGFAEQAYALGLMAFYIGETECFGHEGVAFAVAVYCPGIKLTVVAAQVNNDSPGLTLNRPGLVQQLAVATGASTRVAGYDTAYRRTRCTPELANSAVPVGCGMVSVPESATSARRLEIAVAIAGHADVKPTLEPLLVLGGGPGEPLFVDVPALLSDAQIAEPLVNGQDVVFVEQRGVGASTPALVCEAGLGDSESAANCVVDLQAQGADLGAYNSIRSADDLEILRTTLGVPRWNLLAFSYGTKLALTMYRERPGTIVSLALDGVLSPEQNLEDDPVAFAGVLNEVFSQCSADPGCSNAFPNLQTRFINTMRALDSEPLTVNGVALSGAALVNALSVTQTQPALIEYMPAVMNGMANRDASLLGALTSTSTTSSGTGVTAAFSDAMYFSVICNEEAPFSDQGLLNDLVSGSDPILAAIARSNLNNLAICDTWPSGRAPDRDNLPVNVTVPVLVLNGEFDLQTPATLARMAATNWPKSQLVEFRSTGHAIVKQRPQCALELLIRFERKGAAERVDQSCVSDIASPHWRLALDDGFYALFAAL